ncbi:hypothetical protein [Nonomuraea sp. CA-141351]
MTYQTTVSVSAWLLVWLPAGMGVAGATVGLLLGWWARGQDDQR